MRCHPPRSGYCRELGLAWMDPPPLTAVWGSPFDYAEQALLYAPAGMPDPNSPDYVERVAKVALPLIRAARLVRISFLMKFRLRLVGGSRKGFQPVGSPLFTL